MPVISLRSLLKKPITQVSSAEKSEDEMEEIDVTQPLIEAMPPTTYTYTITNSQGKEKTLKSESNLNIDELNSIIEVLGLNNNQNNYQIDTEDTERVQEIINPTVTDTARTWLNIFQNA